MLGLFSLQATAVDSCDMSSNSRVAIDFFLLQNENLMTPLKLKLKSTQYLGR